jgi:hypothetical protein
MPKYLHELKEFPDLLRIIEEEKGILSTLVEKDYWLMHVLYGLQKQGFEFNLKGGTSLSKGYKIINRFSEDIDIYIRPAEHDEINERSEKPKHVEKRKNYYDRLLDEIKIDGIVSKERDHEFDDLRYYRSGGIRLHYETFTTTVEGVKEGILLEAGFSKVDPFQNLTISSWALDRALSTKGLGIIENRAVEVPCYHPGYTFIEKLQTIATKFRQEKDSGDLNKNFMRQYYDIYCLLNHPTVQSFIGTDEYIAHKQAHFPKKDSEIPINENQAFLLEDENLRKSFETRYQSTSSLYYQGQPSFTEVIERIKHDIDRF